jgi:hypothetical protein
MLKFPSPEPQTLGAGLPTAADSAAHARDVEHKKLGAAGSAPLVSDVRMRAGRALMAIGNVRDCFSALPCRTMPAIQLMGVQAD